MSAIEIGEHDDASPIHIDEIPADVLGMVLTQGLEWIYLIRTAQFVSKRWRHLIWSNTRSIPSNASKIPPPQLLSNLTSLDIPCGVTRTIRSVMSTIYADTRGNGLLESLSTFTKLQTLRIKQPDSDSMWPALPRALEYHLPMLGNLTELALAVSATAVPGKTLFEFAGRITTLRHLLLIPIGNPLAIHDEHLEYLKPLVKLKRLDIMSGSVDNWSRLRGLTHLARLNLPNKLLDEATSTTDAAVLSNIVDRLIADNQLFTDLGLMPSRPSIAQQAFHLRGSATAQKILDAISLSGFRIGRVSSLISKAFSPPQEDLVQLLQTHELTADSFRKVFRKGFKRDSPLLAAIQSCRVEFVDAVLKYYDPVLSKGIRGVPSRMVAEIYKCFSHRQLRTRASLRLLELYPWTAVAPGGLQAAFTSGDQVLLASVLQRLRAHPDLPRLLNLPSGVSKPAIFMAVEALQVPLIVMLLEAGADPTIRIRVDIGIATSAIDLAISIDDDVASEVVRCMKIVPDASILQCAINSNRSRTIRKILSRWKDLGPERSMFDNVSVVPVCATGNLAVLKELLEFGANPNIPSNGLPLAVAAVQAGEIPIVEYVASLPDIDLNAPWTTYNNQSALLEAVTANRYDLAEVLIMSSSDKAKLVNQANSRGCTPLMGTFIKWTNEELVELLINAGADVHATDSSGSTALCYAVEYGTVAAASPLISAGASFSVSRADNRSLLHLAADDLTVRWLHKHLGHNLDPNVQDKFGMTAICQEFARKVLASDKISAMLECFGDRMDLYIRDNHAHHALDILKSRNHADLQVTFRNFAFRDPERAMRYVIEATTSKLVVDGLPRVILELPKERMQSILAIHDGAGRTALHAACKTRNVMLIKSLTSAGASPNTRDSFGRTPLHIICGSELPQATSRFLNSTLESRTDIIALLASVDSAPLDANVIDSSGYTPLTYAIRSGLDSVAQSLVDNYGASWYPASAASSTTFRSPLAVALSVDSPLYAVLAKSPELVNRIDLESNSTPLALAAAAKRLDLEVIKVLVENGADVTPAIDDLRRRISNNSPIAPLLLEKGVQLEMGASPALEAPFNPLEGIFGGFTPSQPSPFGPPPSNMFATMAPTDQAASDHQPSQALQPPLDLFGAGAFQPAPQEQQQQQPPLNLFGGFQLPAANSNNSPNVFRFS